MEDRRMKAAVVEPEAAAAAAAEEEEEEGAGGWSDDDNLDFNLRLGAGRLEDGGEECTDEFLYLPQTSVDGGGAAASGEEDLGWNDTHTKRAKLSLEVEIKVLDQGFQYNDVSTSGMNLVSPLSLALPSSEFQAINEMHPLLNRPMNDDAIENMGMSNDEGTDDGYRYVPTVASSTGNQMDIMQPTGNVGDSLIRMDLTEDLLHLVFSSLGQKDLCKAAAACKQWHAASMHEEFWRCLNFENTSISMRNFHSICRRFPNATEINLSGVYNSDAFLNDMTSYLRQLRTLILGKGQLGDVFFHALAYFPVLNTLSICDSTLGNGMLEMSLHQESLRSLLIVKCRAHRVSIRCPQLRTLSLKRTCMAHAFLVCPQLQELNFSSCHKLSDVAIRTAATVCPLLESLDLSFCSSVGDETLREIAVACPKLRVLDASNCPNISLESVKLPMLVDLKLHSCEGITVSSINAISYSRYLEALQLDNCGMLTSVSLDLPRLQSISLVHCRKFIDLNLSTPVLSYIKISNCSALHHMNIVSNELQKLFLQKQESLALLALQCYKLEEVNLSDCESLTNSICEVFSDGGGCPMLKTLVLDNCESLSVVELNSSSLVTLSLTGCRGMAKLELSCPNLQNVNLDGCDRLENAIFCPVGLVTLNLGICPKLSVLRIEAPKMVSLELKGCGILSQASIDCPCLIFLDASFCHQFVDDSLSKMAISCPQLENLILSSCLSVGLYGLSSLHWLQYLTILDLSYTFLTDLQPVFENCSQLEILKLSACKFLTNSSLDALYKEHTLPLLRELDLSYSFIGQSTIMGLLDGCANLINLNVNGCVNMLDLTWCSTDTNSDEMPMSNSCSSDLLPSVNEGWTSQEARCPLEILNCIGCPSIRKIVIPATARCFYLSKLNLSLSINLKEVNLACANLNSLNLSNCSALEILKLDCARLTNLQLLACSLLEAAIIEGSLLGCPMLETLNVHSCPKVNAAFLESLQVARPTLKRITAAYGLRKHL